MTGERHQADAAEEMEQDIATSVAQSLRNDFVGLIAIFDRQLANEIAADGKTRSNTHYAKATAERGLSLSQELIQLLRTNH
jgi:hypothetical protein